MKGVRIHSPHLRIDGTLRGLYVMGNPFSRNPLPPLPPTMPRRLNWREIRKRHPERMANHLENLNRVNREGAAAREKRLKAIFGVMPLGPFPSFQLRDELSQAWEDVYGIELKSKEAWLEVRFGIRRGVFKLMEDGQYAIMRDDNGAYYDPRRSGDEKAVDGVSEETHSRGEG